MKISPLLTLLALAACQSAPTNLTPSVEPLTILDRFEATYEGTIGEPAQELLQTAPQASEASGPRAEALPLSTQSNGDKPEWAMQATYYQIERSILPRLLGPDWQAGDRLQGWIVSKPAFDALVEHLQAQPGMHVVTAPRVLTFEAQPSEIALIHQTAFIKKFAMQRSPGMTVVDPEVGVLHEGSSLGLTAKTHAGAESAAPVGHLSFDLTHNQLLQMQDIETAFPHGAPLSIQYPVCLRERLSGSLHLSTDQVAILPPMSDPAGEASLTVLHLARVLE